jgi:hypothetical protein
LTLTTVRPRASAICRCGSPSTVAHQDDGAVVGRKLVDGGAEHHPELRLASRVVDDDRPIGDRCDVAARLIEHGKQFVQRDIIAAPAAPPAALIGPIRHDPIEPGAEAASPRKVSIFWITDRKASCTTSSASWLFPVIPVARRMARSL